MNAKLGRIILAAVVLPLLICALSFDAYAGGNDDADFDVKSSSGTNVEGDVAYAYIQVTNNGDDFGGYVRLILGNGNHYDAIVYETYAAIASGTTENITLGIPVPEGINLEDYEATVKILDKQGKELYSARQKKLFSINASQQLGILTNSSSGLDYIEKAFNGTLGGYYYYGNNNYNDQWDCLYMMPAELNDGYTLKQMSFLVIDDFDLSTLKAEQIEAIEEWTRLGGVLVIGTGSNLDQCFDVFDDDFITAELANKYTYSNFSYYSNTGYINVADLDLGKGNYNAICYGELYKKVIGRGAIVLSTFALSDPDVNASYFGEDLYTNLMSVKNSAGNGSGNSRTLSSYDLQRDYGVMQGRSSFSPTILRILILVYVVLVGPGVYLLLKKLDKREKIWLAIPALSLLFVLLVFLFSRGFDMRSKQFTTVRVANGDGKAEETDYIFGFSADRKDWNITLNDDAYAAGPIFYENSYSYNAAEDHYLYRASNNTAGSQLFYSPKAGFDSAFFKTKTDNSVSGVMSAQIELDNSKIVGTLTNDTDYDFDYVLLVCYGYYDIIENVESGENLTINSKSRQRYSDEGTIEDLARKLYNYQDYEEAKLHMALYFAAHELSDQGSFAVGVCKNGNKVIKGGVSEESFLCVYGVK
ncbi:MAG: hypothetical protein IKR23_09365 [Lachnospiraceae bacterium]|nr:hypothetical protein [Lachnospiraceae bacterium]